MSQGWFLAWAAGFIVMPSSREKNVMKNDYYVEESNTLGFAQGWV